MNLFIFFFIGIGVESEGRHFGLVMLDSFPTSSFFFFFF